MKSRNSKGMAFPLTDDSRRPRPAGPEGFPRPAGFTLVEMALVLLIIGLVAGLGYTAWQSLNDASRIQATENRMRAARDCIVAGTVNSGRYPSYDQDYDSPGANVVDGCLDGIEDSWGQPILFLEGLSSPGTGLEGECLDPSETADSSDPCHISNAPVRPDPVNSLATDRDGNTVERVAFILISYGDDMMAADTSYGDRFDIGANQFASVMGATTPDFSTAATLEAEDIYMIVTFYDLMAAFAEAKTQ